MTCQSVPMASRDDPEVTVVGEALVDLVSSVDGSLDAVLGGAPFTTARAMSRLGVAVELCSTISDDRFGGRLVDALVDDGVSVRRVRRVPEPTTLALAELGADGGADYRFYIEGTSCPIPPDLAPPTSGWLFTGGLALVLDPLASAVESMVMATPDAVSLMVDVNCRPRVIPDLGAYVDRVRRVVARADVVKVSDEDLAVLSPGRSTIDAAQDLLALGPAVVIVTAGAAGITVVDADGVWTHPVPTATVVDTIGAGDTFDAGFLTWWAARGGFSADRDDTAGALRAGAAAAAVVVGRRGADPPRLADLDPSLWPIGLG